MANEYQVYAVTAEGRLVWASPHTYAEPINAKLAQTTQDKWVNWAVIVHPLDYPNVVALYFDPRNPDGPRVVIPVSSRLLPQVYLGIPLAA